MTVGVGQGMHMPPTRSMGPIQDETAGVFGDIHDPESPISRFLDENDTFVLREDFGTHPKVHYVRPALEEV